MSNTRTVRGEHAISSKKVDLDRSDQLSNVQNPDITENSVCRSDEDSLLDWLRLVRDRRWTTSQKRQLLDALGSPSDIYAMSFTDSFGYISGRRPKKSSASPNIESQLQCDMQWLSEPGHHVLTLKDQAYPKLLREIADPPIALFAIGNLELLSEPKVAIVGSRRPTPVGAKVTQQIASDLGQLGVVVTSGMALGVDGLAHQAVLNDNVATVAVMGCGLDTIYPSRNRALFEQISRDGLVLSEYPLGVPASKYTFPQRNRIVSGLCYGVVIVEAAERSGTLITARLALEQDRQVMVVPGSSVSTQYVGSHRLLKQGAALVLNGLDVVENLADDLSHELSKQKLKCRILPDTNQEKSASGAAISTEFRYAGEGETAILKFISIESTPVDRIIFESGLTAAEVSSMLLILEMQGLVVVGDDGGYLNIS